MLALLLTALSLPCAQAVTDAEPAPRAIQAAVLRAALEQDALADAVPAVRLERLAAAASSAALQLTGDGADLALQAAVRDARWRAFVDPGAGAEDLVEQLEELAVDLTFEPYMEAPVPVGWPSWTPVQAIQVKDYPAYRLAEAPMGGSSQTGAFFALFNHIQRNEIPMTAPVEMSYEDDEGYLDETRMAFLYESPEQETPAGVQGEVEIRDVAPMSALTIGLRGRATTAAIERAARRLERELAGRSDLRATGAVRTLGYNGPSVPRRANYFEVQIPVQRVDPGAGL